jgi:phage/plasmid-like protein (TIGR03299 family)
MSHELEIVNGVASFAYNAENGDPWHRLGTPMDGLQTLDEMLHASRADRHVTKFDVYAMTPDGFTHLPDAAATFMPSVDGESWDYLGVVGNEYPVVQNRTSAELALTVVGASKGDAVIDTMGVLYNGKRFFAYIDLGSLVIDPTGVNDRIARGLGVLTDHVGQTSVTLANTNTRWVCNNTVTFGLTTARSVYRCRHTSTVEQQMVEAQAALRISTKWSAEFVKQAEKLLAVPADHDTVNLVFNTVWPVKDADTPRKEANRSKRSATIHRLYDGPTNAQAVGHNGWAVYNAFGEYLDHYRPASADARARASIALGGKVHDTKIAVADQLLSLAG